MEGIRQYIISVTAAAILCGVLTSLIGQKQIKPVWRLIVGTFLTLTAIRPLATIDLGAVPTMAEAYSLQAGEAVRDGESMAAEATFAIIKPRLEAYILDKAESMGVTLRVDISLDERGVPISVLLCGDVSPGAKARLQSMIENDLGIPKEAQIWRG